MQRDGLAQSKLCFEKKTEKPPPGSRRHTKLVTEDKEKLSSRWTFHREQPTLMLWLYLRHVSLPSGHQLQARILLTPNPRWTWAEQPRQEVTFLNATEINEIWDLFLILYCFRWLSKNNPKPHTHWTQIFLICLELGPKVTLVNSNWRQSWGTPPSLQSNFSLSLCHSFLCHVLIFACTYLC